MSIDNNPLIEDDQVIVEQIEQSADEQDEGMKDAEIDNNNNNNKTRRKKMKKRKKQ